MPDMYKASVLEVIENLELSVDDIYKIHVNMMKSIDGLPLEIMIILIVRAIQAITNHKLNGKKDVNLFLEVIQQNIAALIEENKNRATHGENIQ